MLGGSHGINAMLYIRGNDRDYNFWEELGNTGWSYENILTYFKKSEANKSPSLSRDTRHHNDNGLLPISDYLDEEEQDPVVNLFIDAWEEFGLKRIDDLNADIFIGYGYAQGTVFGGRRQTTAKTFLIPASKRPNLHIIKHAHATKIIFDGQKAVGVDFVYQYQHNLTVKMRKEVILSAGTFMSPHLLMLSGIGPKEHLDKFNIPVLSDLPVGKNMEDHLFIHLFFEFNRTDAINEVHATDDLDAIYEYAMHQSGLYSHIGLGNFQTFYNSKNDSQYPDIQINYHFFKQNSSDIEMQAMRMKEPARSLLLEKSKASEIGLIMIILLNPNSLGRVELNDTNPLSKPNIYPNYFDHPDDMETSLRAVKQVINLTNTKSFRDNQGKLIYLPTNECSTFSTDSDDYLRCYIRAFSKSVSHFTSTSRMGPATDNNSVVDPRLRVKGVTALRQIDAGIMPHIVSANTNAAAAMIGEKGADLVKEDWNYSTQDNNLK